MADTWWTDEQKQTLRVGDVMPLPRMVETNWATDGWEVNVTLVTDVVSGGRQDHDEAARVTDAAVTAFGLRLRAVLAQGQ